MRRSDAISLGSCDACFSLRTVPLSQLKVLENTMVTVVTYDGTPVAVGRLRVAAESETTTVLLTFKTDLIQCAVVLLPEEVDALCAMTDREVTRYVLPEGKKFWLRERPVTKTKGDEESKSAQDNALVETFPLPADAKLGASIAPAPTKNTDQAPSRRQPSLPQKVAPLERINVQPVRPISSPGR